MQTLSHPPTTVELTMVVVSIMKYSATPPSFSQRNRLMTGGCRWMEKIFRFWKGNLRPDFVESTTLSSGIFVCNAESHPCFKISYHIISYTF
jgi:hypothetical protein